MGYISDYSCKDVDFNGCRDIQDLFIHRSDVEEIEIEYDEMAIDTFLYLFNISKEDFEYMAENFRTCYYNI